jgi:hypothetical protein
MNRGDQLKKRSSPIELIGSRAQFSISEMLFVSLFSLRVEGFSLRVQGAVYSQLTYTPFSTGSPVVPSSSFSCIHWVSFGEITSTITAEMIAATAMGPKTPA